MTTDSHALATYDNATAQQPCVGCFVEGTRIATPGGALPVQGLRPGMDVQTLTGIARIAWVGRRTIRLRRHPHAESIAPIRVRADAFAKGRPVRDLRLAPDHAIHISGRLLPVRCLTNGATIARNDCDTVIYRAIELDRHAIVLVEGLACENGLPGADRSDFAGGKIVPLHPRFAPGRREGASCVPVIADGQVEAAILNARYWQRALTLGYSMTADPALQVVCGGRALERTLASYPLPAREETVRLRSRSFVPQELNPDHSDPRRLGVALTGAWFDGEPAPEHAYADGFYPQRGALRWTDGDAVLRIPAGARRLRLAVANLRRFQGVGRHFRRFRLAQDTRAHGVWRFGDRREDSAPRIVDQAGCRVVTRLVQQRAVCPQGGAGLAPEGAAADLIASPAG
jgi:hypothetical protein